jgi:hypothetical protein
VLVAITGVPSVGLLIKRCEDGCQAVRYNVLTEVGICDGIPLDSRALLIRLCAIAAVTRTESNTQVSCGTCRNGLQE